MEHLAQRADQRLDGALEHGLEPGQRLLGGLVQLAGVLLGADQRACPECGHARARQADAAAEPRREQGRDRAQADAASTDDRRRAGTDQAARQAGVQARPGRSGQAAAQPGQDAATAAGVLGSLPVQPLNLSACPVDARLVEIYAELDLMIAALKRLDLLYVTPELPVEIVVLQVKVRDDRPRVEHHSPRFSNCALMAVMSMTSVPASTSLRICGPPALAAGNPSSPPSLRKLIVPSASSPSR